MGDVVWRPGDQKPRPPLLEGDAYRPDILEIIEKTIDELSPALRELSQDILAHPELKFGRKKQGFVVQRHYLLETAWVATYIHGQGGPVLGVNSEMDALPGIGHACGHNLIGIAGVAIACAAKAAMQKLGIDGKVILLGTPGEEGGFGKVELWEKGAYEEMDVCLMCHPAPGPPYSVSLSSCLAMVKLRVDFVGHTAHAGLSPWEGQNALDAAVLAYTSIGLLRQQTKPTHRIHGIFEGKDWAPNSHWFVRAPTTNEALETTERVKACFEAAAIATGCKVTVAVLSLGNELVQNSVLGEELADVVCKKYGTVDYEWGIASASTDFRSISLFSVTLTLVPVMPGLHPGFSIPSVPNGGNHTPAFTEAASTMEAHEACLDVSKALAAVGMRVLTDKTFLSKASLVKSAFEEAKRARSN
ncbi:hypothetical protein F5141DRAFT_1186064 [Pisolithus sp. B1]|nr:hypothetical protein F5141DRAFT_1186064 [Pisolithus sp. B1]